MKYKKAVEGDPAALKEASRIIRVVNKNRFATREERKNETTEEINQHARDMQAISDSGQFLLALMPSKEFAETLADLFDAWARMGGLNLDMLNRVGGTELVAMARIIVKGYQG